jgi:hypothetical protein
VLEQFEKREVKLASDYTNNSEKVPMGDPEEKDEEEAWEEERARQHTRFSSTKGRKRLIKPSPSQMQVRIGMISRGSDLMSTIKPVL